MGGPWKARGFDATAWRTPVARAETAASATEARGRDRLYGIVVAYIASVVTSLALTLTLLARGW